MDPETSPSLPEAVVVAQREVQRKLGRTLIRLQQYELLMKQLVVAGDIGGSADELANVQAMRHAETARKSLGQVVGELTKNIVSPASSSTDQYDRWAGDGTQISFRTTFRWEMSEENLARKREDLTNLVALRNELVHHFLERFNIWTEPGCLAADAYLDDAYREIDRHLEQLEQIAQGFDEARTHLLKIMQSQEFLDLLTSGRWVSVGIIRLLQEAETTLARDGWTLLEDAIAFIQTREPGHEPGQYGCVSWRQVLHESKQFEIRRDRTPGAASRTRYRSRPRGTDGCA